MRARELLWWASLAFGVAGACLWVPLYNDFPFAAGAACVLLSGVLAGWGARHSAGNELHSSRWPRVGLALVGAACVSFVPAPMQVGVGLLALGAAIAVAGGRRANGVGSGVAASGLLSLLLVGTSGLYVRFVASSHEASILRLVEAGLAKVFGWESATVGAEIILPAGSTFLPAAPSWDQFGLVYGLLLVVGVVGFVGLTQGARGMGRIAIRSIATAAAYLVARHFVLLLVALDAGRPDVFWIPSVALSTLAPLCALLVFASGARGGWNAAPLLRDTEARPKRTAAAAGILCAGVLLVSLAFLLAPAGAPHGGRVLFDEAHGAWESTSQPMDTEWYGLASTYNYDSLYQWLQYYYDTQRITAPIAPDSLEPGDVLVLKTPSIPYSAEEIETIEAHVRRGGGLFVIGDHTNVFGTTSVLNPVIERFGLRLGYDATYRLRDGGFTVYEPQGTTDPIFQHVPRFEFLTSCSLRGGAFTLSTIYDGGMLASAADYSTRNFFPERRITLTSAFGAFLQAGAVEAGRGRVVVFTDSTCFSNFSLHMDGYTSFLLGAIEYLQRGSPLPGWRAIAVALGGVAAIVALIILTRSRQRFALAVGILGALVGWTAAVTVTTVVHRATYPVPAPRLAIPYVYFDLGEGRARIAPQPSAADSAGLRDTFATFFAWTQRIGLVPTLVSPGLRTIGEARPYVVLNPGPPRDEMCNLLIEHVKAGGSLVLLGDPARDREALAAYCALFEIEMTTNAVSALVLPAGIVSAHEISPAQTLYVSVVPVEFGRVVLLSDSVAFSDLALGSAFVVPSTVQRRLYDVEFWLFGDLTAERPAD